MLYLNRKLHIVHTESSGGWGGQDMRVLAESIGLMERGHRVTIVTAAAAPGSGLDPYAVANAMR